MFQSITLRDNERGVVIRGGRVRRWLEPGSHTLFGFDLSFDRLNMDDVYADWSPELEAVAPTGSALRLDVGQRELALVRRGGLPAAALGAGRYLIWTLRDRVDVERVDLAPVQIELDAAWITLAPAGLLQVVRARPYERALVYVDGALHGALGAGRVVLSRLDREVEVVTMDTRQKCLRITGQELMTADKVSLRMNLSVDYRIDDAVLAVQAARELQSSLHTAAQVAARRVVGSTRLDDLLEQRNLASDAMRESLAGDASAWGVAVRGVDVVDVVLPGDMKVILNQVIEAEKRAAANVITRREETAATRSAANTARLLEANPTLMRLRELEALRDIAGQVENLTIVAGAGEIAGRLGVLKT